MELKWVFVLAGMVFLGGLLVLAIILAATGTPKDHLMTVIFSMMFASIIMFSMGLMTRVLRPLDPLEPLDGPSGESRQKEDFTIG